jgi:hypothetical protein
VVKQAVWLRARIRRLAVRIFLFMMVSLSVIQKPGSGLQAMSHKPYKEFLGKFGKEERQGVTSVSFRPHADLRLRGGRIRSRREAAEYES